MSGGAVGVGAGAVGVGAVIFDLDGTLFESQRLYGEAYQAAVLPLLEKPLTREDLMRINARSESAFFNAAVPEHQRAAARQAFWREYDALHESAFGGVFDGVRELLSGLDERGLRRGIVSGKSRGSWEITSARTGLDGFHAVVLDDDVERPKPDPQGILLAVERLELAVTEAVYVGDTASDMEAALAAGVRPVLATWAPAEEGRRRRALDAADAAGAPVAAEPAEVVEILLGR
ncbi:MAG: HAD-IA family hydrolase [Gemmatimonadota bacterium]